MILHNVTIQSDILRWNSQETGFLKGTQIGFWVILRKCIWGLSPGQIIEGLNTRKGIQISFMSTEKPLIIPDVWVRIGQTSLRSPTSPKSPYLDASEVFFSFVLHDECVLVGALLIIITQGLKEVMYPSWHMFLKSVGKRIQQIMLWLLRASSWKWQTLLFTFHWPK